MNQNSFGLKDILSPADINAVLRMTLIFLLGFFFLGSVAYLLSPTAAALSITRNSIMLAGIALISTFFLRKEWTSLFVIFLLSACGVVLFIAAWDGAGIMGPAYISCIVIVVGATMYWGQRAGLIVTMIVAFAGLGLLIAGRLGWLINGSRPVEDWFMWATVVSIFILLAIMTGVTLQYLQRQLLQTRREEEEIRRLNAILEQRIDESTAELAKSEERYRRIASVISDYSYSAVVDAQGNYSPEWVAGAFAEITGYDFDDYLACGGWENLLHPDSRGQDLRDRDALFLNQVIDGSILQICRKDGGLRWVRNFAHPVWNYEENRLAGVYGGVQDITLERQAAERMLALNTELEERVAERTAELENALDELGSLSYAISHDLRAPLRAVNGYASILLSDYSGNLPQDGIAKLMMIKDSGSNMGRLVDGLLEYLRSGSDPLARQTIQPGEIVHAVIERLRPEYQDRKVEFIIGDLPPCLANFRMLEKIYDGLIGNAVKFTRNRTEARIEIGSIQDHEHPVYFVRDNGVGFDMKYYDKLFGVFQRLHHVDEFEGVGVNLAIVQRMILQHGGNVWAKAEPDQGASFFFIL